MSDLFASLVDRALGRAPVLPLRLPGVFEAAPAWEDSVGDGPDADEERVVAVATAVTAVVPEAEPGAPPPLRDRRLPSPAEPATTPAAAPAPAPPVLHVPEAPRPTVSPRPVAPDPAPPPLQERIVALIESALDRPPPPPPLAPAAAAPAAGDEPMVSQRQPAPTPPPPVILRVPGDSPSPRTEDVAPTVEVRIGRIEVKAVPAPAPAPRPHPVARPTTARRASVPLPLQDYLRARGRR